MGWGGVELMPLAVLSLYTCVQWVKFGCIAYESEERCTWIGSGLMFENYLLQISKSNSVNALWKLG